MYFASDNGTGPCAEVLEFVCDALRSGPVPSYGKDHYTYLAEQRIADLFEHEVSVFFCVTGTAANALALAHITPPWGAVFGHELSHGIATECGAPEFYSGAKLLPLSGEGGKISAGTLENRLDLVPWGDPQQVQPSTLSLTNLTECGLLYTPSEIKVLADVAREHRLSVHMDGARFANAIAAARCSPADMTWKSGVDVLTFGGTKNGAIAAEAVIFFDVAKANGFQFRRTRGGHLLSKMRFVSAQFIALLENGLWLKNASRANLMASRLAAGLDLAGIPLAWPTEGNEVFVVLSASLAQKLQSTGLLFYSWPDTALPKHTSLPPDLQLSDDECVYRFVCSFETTEDQVDSLLSAVTS